MYQFVSCLLISCLAVSAVSFVSLSYFVHFVSSVSYPQSHCVSYVARVSANLSHFVSDVCLNFVSCLTCLCVLSPVSHDLVSCLTNSAMNLLVSYVLKIVSYLTWTALG